MRAALPTRRRRGRVARALEAVLPPDRVLTDPLALHLYAGDASHVRGEPAAVAIVRTRAELQAVLATCHREGVPFTARGAGTALTGSASPLEQSVVVATAGMDRIVSVDVDRRMAWVEPGVVNADLSTAVAPHRLHYAPDPSSQGSCTIGGNIATNAGGAHTLLHGVTTSHVLAVELVLPDGRVTTLGSTAPEDYGPDLRGLVVGSEGTMGVVASAAVHLTPLPAAHRTLLFSFDTVTAAGAAVSAVVAAGVSPSAIELMDGPVTRAVEAWLGAGLPTDAEAVVLLEVEGEPETAEAAARQATEVGGEWAAHRPRVAADEAQRALWWRARKGAIGAMAQIAPNYYLHDTVIPRTRLADVLSEIAEIGARWQLPIVNVFHAGDGNLHPVIAYDRRVPGIFDRVLEAGSEIIKASLDVGGVLTGEHGIGVEKLAYMAQQFDPASLDLQRRLRAAFDPQGLANPGKVLPSPGRCVADAGAC